MESEIFGTDAVAYKDSLIPIDNSGMGNDMLIFPPQEELEDIIRGFNFIIEKINFSNLKLWKRAKI